MHAPPGLLKSNAQNWLAGNAPTIMDLPLHTLGEGRRARTASSRGPDRPKNILAAGAGCYYADGKRGNNSRPRSRHVRLRSPIVNADIKATRGDLTGPLSQEWSP